MSDMRMNLDGLTAPELASLDDGSGDIYRARQADVRARLTYPPKLPEACEPPVLGTILMTLTEEEKDVVLLHVATWAPEVFEAALLRQQAIRDRMKTITEHPEPLGTIEAVIADSIEHQSRYRNELRHLPATTTEPAAPVVREGGGKG